jgi:hypothetical protein
MSSIEKINFEPLSDILHTQRRDYPLADPNLADPLNSLALIDGEWLVLNADFKLVRAADIAAAGNLAASTSWVNFMERGRYDRRALSQTKNTIIQLGDYIADTRIYDASATYGGAGVVIDTVMQPLKVASIDIGGKIVCGLVGHGGAADTDPIVGRVLRLPANNGGKLMFERASSI